MIWIIGAGDMALAYAKVLKAQNQPFKVIGRGAASAITFEQKTGVRVIREPLARALEGRDLKDDHVIVCVNTLSSYELAIDLLDLGCKKLLLEKPAVLTLSDGSELLQKAKANDARVFIALNRRYYKSVSEAKKVIVEDGGLTSIRFDFTEWSHVIGKLNHPPEVLSKWLLCNSLHVIDLAISFMGSPSVINCQYSGSLPWHKHAQFNGSGVSSKGIPFSYHADWESAGRWSIELFTRERRLLLSPLEYLQFQNRGTLDCNKYEADYSVDEKYKAGLYNQVKDFVNDKALPVSISDYVASLPQIFSIAGYDV